MSCNCENVHCSGKHFKDGKVEGEFSQCQKKAGHARANWIGAICDDCAACMPVQDMRVMPDGSSALVF